jgi:hypothetical protein
MKLLRVQKGLICRFRGVIQEFLMYWTTEAPKLYYCIEKAAIN